MQKWEYLYVRASAITENGRVHHVSGEYWGGKEQGVNQFLKERGSDGWELVGAGIYESDLLLFLKRLISN